MADSCIPEPRQVCREEANILVKKESLEKEKQILVDPISLQGSAAGEASFSLMLSPAVDTRMRPASNAKFLSYSLPNSTSSSPRFSSVLSKKKWKNESQMSPRQVEKLEHLNLAPDERFRRSKSSGEGRASVPTDELDLWMHKPTGTVFEKHQAKTDEARKDDGSKRIDAQEDGFKCSALCLYLPGFGKGKPVRARKEDSLVNVISRRVSLEKFECGSWASSAIVPDEEVESMSMYFDLPMELIRSSANDAHSPISAAFVFDKDVKGVLKNGSRSNTGRKCNESPRHVRFSTSSTSLPASPGSSCITPRLRKAREDFNAFLEAQSAS
ncbi:uncharacterized protein LOC110811543 [Carica papaya]|uniref:uncharacterized protein LOC110811543 n=1 Tax=Carica papaya TaxID=3649 RepID=UPI000B8C7A29|nr:uncharacterized protein LOC110811543 [Carica papaya]